MFLVVWPCLLLRFVLGCWYAVLFVVLVAFVAFVGGLGVYGLLCVCVCLCLLWLSVVVCFFDWVVLCCLLWSVVV